MSVFNLGVVFGPTLLRAVEETLAAILDIKFNNVVIEILIENYDLMFKSPPGKTSDYLSHSNTNMSPPEPVPRTYGSYRSSQGSVHNTQPVMRVVTRANYTDTVMSSSLQNIPNGLAIYQNTGNNAKSHQPIYESKPHMNQSTPSLNHVLPGRDHSIGRDSQSTYLTSASPNSNHLNSSHSPNHRSGSAGSAIINAHQNHLSSRDKLMQNSRDIGKSIGRDASNLSSPMTRSTNEGIYVQIQSQRLNPMNYSESNLVHPMSAIDRINSTSSSNESVCSTSSLNHSYTRQTKSAQTQQHQPAPPLPTYLDYNNTSNNYAIRDDASQKYLPQKMERSKELVRQRYNSPRDNV